MRSNVITIMKKEFARFFKDKRMVFTTILMPGLMIYVMYSFMGQGMSGLYGADESYTPKIYAENLPPSIANIEGIPVVFLEEDEESCDLLAIFPENFETKIAAYDVTTGEEAPEVELYYNSTDTNSAAAYGIMLEILDSYETSMANKFNVNSGEDQYDMASEEDTTSMIFSMMLPMLMMIFIFSGCMAVAPESIAGEKERGTIATLLITPMKRGHLALGKILSLSIIAILSGISSFLGTMLSLPKLMDGMEGLSTSVYQISDYGMLLVIILSTVLIIISLISIISAFAKNVKEATTWVTPLMIVVVVIAVTGMVESMKPKSLLMYLIPLYNSVQCMNGIFSFTIQTSAILITVVSNIIYSMIFVGVLTKMFNSEKVVFSR